MCNKQFENKLFYNLSKGFLLFTPKSPIISWNWHVLSMRKHVIFEDKCSGINLFVTYSKPGKNESVIFVLLTL